MADVETAVGEAAIERVMAIFEQMKNLRYQDQVQARKAVTDFIYPKSLAASLARNASWWRASRA